MHLGRYGTFLQKFTGIVAFTRVIIFVRCEPSKMFKLMFY